MFSGTVKSAAGLGAILSKGIGNTMRISLSADPVEEVKVARELLKVFGLASNMATLISCPTCGRIEIDLISIANEVEEYIQTIKAPIKVSVLGCAVNGPGEAREADIGIAGARGEGLLFRKGEIVRKVPEETMVEELKKEIDLIAQEYYEKEQSKVLNLKCARHRLNIKNIEKLGFESNPSFFFLSLKERQDKDANDNGNSTNTNCPCTKTFRSFLRLIKPPMIPSIPNKNGIINKERMERIKDIAPTNVPPRLASSVRFRVLSKD